MRIILTYFKHCTSGSSMKRCIYLSKIDTSQVLVSASNLVRQTKLYGK